MNKPVRVRLSTIPGAAVGDRRLSHAEFRVLSYLGLHTNDDGWCAPSQKALAKEIGCKRDTVIAAVWKLQTLGYLEIEERSRESGARGENRYRVNLNVTYQDVEKNNEKEDFLDLVPPVPEQGHPLSPSGDTPCPSRGTPPLSPKGDTPCPSRGTPPLSPKGDTPCPSRGTPLLKETRTCAPARGLDNLRKEEISGKNKNKKNKKNMVGRADQPVAKLAAGEPEPDLGAASPSRSVSGSKTLAEAFDRLWSTYPHARSPSGNNRSARKPSRSAWDDARRSGSDPADIQAAAEEARRRAQANPDDAKFMPAMQRWLRERRFDDVLADVPSADEPHHQFRTVREMLDHQQAQEKAR